MGGVLVDTNVVVYAYGSDDAKRARAVEVMDLLVRAGVGFLSTQVLAEFCVAASRKLKPPLTWAQITERVQNYLAAWRVLEVTGPIVMEAVRGVAQHGFSYWDAQIWATARLNQIPVVLSEDLGSRSASVEGVWFVDPFAPEFDPTAFITSVLV
ncbi:MAG: PIN domain-containing protein [Firmicutes bacterium]|nr:PIN domain-containing protein [Bacillota bacterium]